MMVMVMVMMMMVVVMIMVMMMIIIIIMISCSHHSHIVRGQDWLDRRRWMGCVVQLIYKPHKKHVTFQIWG